MITSKPEYDVCQAQMKRASIPHDILLFNLIGNHILIQVLAGGLAKTFPWVLFITPTISLVLIAYTLWRASKSPKRDTPFVQCHWAVAAKRTRLFLVMLGVLAAVSSFAAIAHFFMGLMQEAAIALVVGGGILPVMVTMLILIMMESEALHMAKHKRAPSCPGILDEKDAIPMEMEAMEAAAEAA